MTQEPDPVIAPTSGREDRDPASILVADDEQGVRETIVAMLKWRGYKVSGARDGSGALEVLRSGAQPVDLLVTDIDMPGMNGLELSRCVIAERPNVRVLLISGKPVFAGRTRLPFLMKPFTPSQLGHAVEAVLSQPPPTLPDATG